MVSTNLESTMTQSLLLAKNKIMDDTWHSVLKLLAVINLEYSQLGFDDSLML